MSLEKLDTEVRKQQIAKAALDLVTAKGTRALNISEIAKRVGVVPSAIYRHFGSKDQILDAMLDLIRENLLANVRTVCTETSDPIERLHRLLVRHVGLIVENRAIPRIIFSEDVYGGEPERRAKVYEMIRTYLERIGQIVREGQAAARLRPGIEPSTAALMFLGMIQPAAILWHVSDGAFDVARHAEAAWKVFLSTIRLDA
ncbi:MAG: TetR/AcrR family transcriptional regulator [bacterium]